MSQEAIPAARPAARWWMLVLAWAAFTMVSLGRSVWGPAAPAVGQDLRVTVAALGTFATSYYVGYVVSNFLGGVASDWLGPRFVLATSMLATGVGMSLFGLVHSMAAGFAIQALIGLFAGADFSAGAKTVSNWFVGRERTFAVSLFSTATSLGTVIANLVVPTMIITRGWRLSYHVFGWLSVALGVLVLLAMRDNPAVGRTATRARGQLPRIGTVLVNRDLVLIALAGFASVWGTYGFIAWSNTLMIKGLHIKPVDAGNVVALFAITAVIGKPIVGFVTARLPIHPKYAAIAIFALFAVMLVVFANLKTLPQFFVAAPLLGFAAYCSSPIQSALILDYAGRSLAGSAVGILNAIWQLGNVIVPVVVGVVFASTHSVLSAFLTLAAGPVVAALLTIPLSSRFAGPDGPAVAERG